jgi:glycosyltransferase involved in cell wall biosynthesis
MSKRPAPSHTLHVLVSTPSGTSGQGGIDRVMAALRQEIERRDDAEIDVRFAPSRGPGHVSLSIFYVIAFCMRMFVSHIAGRLDVVHINVSSYGSTYRKIIISGCARLFGIPYVLHLHGSEYQTFWKDGDSFWGRRTRSMFEHAARVVVLGRVWRDFVAHRAPGAAGNIVIVPNATAIPSLSHVGGGDRVHILFLGRIGERKGVPQLIQALARLKQIGRWRATIAGDGDVEATRAKSAELGLAGYVTLPGWVGSAAVAALLASADILVLPSFAENLPVAVIEAMAAGLAVITTPVGAVEDIITDEETGLLVPPGDVAALTDALTRLINDPALRARLGAAAMAVHRERLELSPFADALSDVWRAAVHVNGLKYRLKGEA